MTDTIEEKGPSGPIVIKRRIRQPAASHGSAWKVAYADFVTAMMAFFLLLWLINVTPEDVKQGISDYFEPIGVSTSGTGSGGVLQGLVVAVEGALRSPSSPPHVTVPIPKAGSVDAGTTEGRDALPETEGGRPTDPVDRQTAETEDPELTKVASALRQALAEASDISRMQDSLLIEQTPLGLQIQILDRLTTPLFENNGPELSNNGRHLLAIIGSIIAQLPNVIAITGHTDQVSRKTLAGTGRSAWELSGDRADNARRTLNEVGLTADRIASVIGRGDREPLYSHATESQRNDRISILLLRQTVPLPRHGSTGTKQDG